MSGTSRLVWCKVKYGEGIVRVLESGCTEEGGLVLSQSL